MKYDVMWIHDEISISKIKNNYDIILVELYHNKNIPIFDNCKYIIQQPFVKHFQENGYVTDKSMKNIFKNIDKNNILLWRPYLN